MRNRALIIAAAVAGLAIADQASAGSTFLYDASQAYRSASDSPFTSGGASSSSFYIENFEDGLLNAFGVTANTGGVKGPGNSTDSVDFDDGNLDGFGRGGHSYSVSGKSVVFRFADEGGFKPTAAGLVWTDGKPNSNITFKAWNDAGELIGKIKVTVGEAGRNGQTLEDRFLGVVSDEGISKIKLVSNRAGFEVDHIQFAYGFAVVPLPAPLALGLVGLAGVAITRRWANRRRPS